MMRQPGIFREARLTWPIQAAPHISRPLHLPASNDNRPHPTEWR